MYLGLKYRFCAELKKKIDLMFFFGLGTNEDNANNEKIAT